MNETVLFTCGHECYTPAHVLATSALWGELESLAVAVRRRCASLARARRDDAPVTDEVLQELSENFRRAHGLRTARATEAWMAARGVSLDAFTDFLERDALDRLDETTTADTAATEDVPLDALWTDAVFTGVGDSWCQRLAARVAVARETPPATGPPASIFEPLAAAGLKPDALRRCVDQFELPLAWIDIATAQERAFARYAESVQTPARLGAAMRARWDTLFSMDFEMGAFGSEAAAREACLCVTEDGDPIQAVCTVAGGVFQGGRVLLGDLPEKVRSHALSATAGSLLPVFDWNGQHIVCRIQGKTEPSLDDARIREVLAHDVLMEAVTPLIARHIEWPAGSNA